MFKVNGTYANRIGKYTVLSINPPKMTVRYEDGSVAELKIAVQERIWENIADDFAKKEANQARKRSALNQNTKYFIKVTSVQSGDELSFPGWSEGVVMASPKATDPIMHSGDRIIFFVSDSKTFVGVATITDDPEKKNPIDYFYTLDTDEMDFFSIDIDAASPKLSSGVPIDSVELESQPTFRRMKLGSESLLEINEDDFELLAELITEIMEDEEDSLEDEDEDEYEDEEA